MIPPPPADKGKGCDRILLITLPAATTLYRFIKSHFKSGLFFGATGDWRWDSPDGHYRTLYVADSVDGAFSETFGHDVTKHPLATPKYLSETELRSRNVFEITATRDLLLASFHGRGLGRLNLDGNICSHPDYAIPQQWSQWTHDCPCTVDGILYHGRHLPTSQSIVLFERCRTELTDRDLGPAAEWQNPKSGADIWDIMESQGWDLALG